MDEEADFANLLSQSTIARPTWSSGPATGGGPSSPDPWANPFSSSGSPTNPFASSTSAFGSTSAYVPAPTPALRLDQAQDEEADFAATLERSRTPPYVAQLEEDDKYGRGILPDPPSVIAAREQELVEAESVFTNPYADTDPAEGGFQAYSPPRHAVPTPPAVVGSGSPVSRANTRMLPSDLIDEDLLAASDPSISLKKAFVKSTPAPRAQKEAQGKKAYVFTPAKVETPKSVAKNETDKSQVEGAKQADVQVKSPVEKADDKTKEDKGEEAIKADDKSSEGADVEQETVPFTAEAGNISTSDPVNKSDPPESIPLPDSALPSPTISRIASPLPNKSKSSTPTKSPQPPPTPTNDLFSPVPSSTPKHDRVAVSPLDPPAPSKPDYGFQALSIGGTTTNSNFSANAPPPPPKTATATSTDWSQPSTSTSTGTGATSSRFAGKGWAAVDEVDDLFGGGGPSVKSDPWGETAGEGWAGDNVPIMGGSSQVRLV
jgi:hypothetical protein